MSAPAVLEARALVRHYPVQEGLSGRAGGRVVRALDGVDLEVRKGETLGIVGESGCGKSTLARLLLRLDTPTAGSIRFAGTDLAQISERAMRPLRRRLQIVFQDPFSSLNPRMSVRELLEEPLLVHGMGSRAERLARVLELLDLVGLARSHLDRWPHEFSGGQRQRIGIARALATGPELIIGDEPVSALDVSVQAQVVNLLQDLKERFGLTLVIIAHDLAVVRHVADRVAVMYLGKVVEQASSELLFARPRHPYTRALMAAVPRPDPAPARQRALLEGDAPSPIDPPSGCRFRTRCPFAQPVCAEREPPLEPGPEGQLVACHFSKDIAPPDHETAAEPPPPLARRLALYARARARMEAAGGKA